METSLSNESTDSKKILIQEGDDSTGRISAESKSEHSKPVLESVKHPASSATVENESYFDNLDPWAEESCNHCALMFEQPSQIKEDDRVYMNSCIGEILIFPTDETQDEDWIQKSQESQKIKYFIPNPTL